LHGSPGSAGFPDGALWAGAQLGDVLQNPGRQFFHIIEGLNGIARSIGGKRCQPEGQFGCLFREFIHLRFLMTAPGRL
jgi:hypothetical protein